MDAPENRRRRPYLIAGSLIALLFLGGILLDRNTRPRLLAGPMVQIPEPGALTIVWQAKVYFSGGKAELTHPDGRTEEAVAEHTGEQYEAAFRNLTPGGKYFYTVLNRGFLAREIPLAGSGETATAPPRGTGFRFVAFGDSGTGGNSQVDLASVIARARPDLVIHTGDLIYPVGSLEDYPRKFFEPYGAIIRRAPFMPALGNHDCVTDLGRPLTEIFVLPRNAPAVAPAPSGTALDLAERCYWFDYGDARFVALDSNPAGGEQGGVLTPEQMKTLVAPWLRQVLTASGAKWRFVYFHHPFYTGSRHSESGGQHMKDAYVNIMEECSVDIVFYGHNHLYERTAPIKGNQVVADGAGVVHVTTGAGGAQRYEEMQPPPPYMRAYRDDVFSFTQVDVAPDRLVLQQIGEDGLAFDEYVIAKNAPAAGSAVP